MNGKNLMISDMKKGGRRREEERSDERLGGEGGRWED